MFADISSLIGSSFIFGIFLAVVILALTRRRDPVAGELAQRPTTLGWWTLAFGLTAAMAFALTTWWPINSNIAGRSLNMISITLAVAAVLAGIGNLRRHDRHWPTWVGIILGLIPAVFWIALVAANSFRFGK